MPDEAANLPILVRSSGSWCELGLFFPNSTSTILFASRTSADLFNLRLLPVWIGQVRLVLFGRHGEPLMQHFYSNGVTIVTQQNDSTQISWFVPYAKLAFSKGTVIKLGFTIFKINVNHTSFISSLVRDHKLSGQWQTFRNGLGRSTKLGNSAEKYFWLWPDQPWMCKHLCQVSTWRLFRPKVKRATILSTHRSCLFEKLKSSPQRLSLQFVQQLTTVMTWQHVVTWFFKTK